jgi:hypothetical protein
MMMSKSLNDQREPKPKLLRSRPDDDNAIGSADAEQPEAIEVLEELFLLLEEYAPAWYTERLHNRVRSALRLK